MDTGKRLELIRGISEEIISESELTKLLDEKKNPTAYDGFEPSGVAHIGSGILRAITLEDLSKAGIKFKILIADWHAWINNKMNSDLDSIQSAGNYFTEVWKAAGVKNVDMVWASEVVKDDNYWKKVIQVAKSTTMNRAERAISIMGRKAGEMKEVSQLFYPMMQVADVFHLDVDITQLGLDQRRAGMLAREVAEKNKWKKPVIVSHHMLMGLEGVKKPESYDDNQKLDEEISSKMSKSKPDTAIFVHDTESEIARKLKKAYCPVKVAKNNPVLEYNRYIVFRKMKNVKIERDKKFGGDVTYKSYNEMEKDFTDGNLHPMDLKNSTAKSLAEVMEPVRKHFEKNSKAKELHRIVSGAKITR